MQSMFVLNGVKKLLACAVITFFLLVVSHHLHAASPRCEPAVKTNTSEQRIYPIVLKRKLGFINQHGAVVVPAKYELMLCGLNRTWKPKRVEYFAASIDDMDWEWNQQVIEFPSFYNGFCNIIENNLLGYIRDDGKIIFEPRFQRISGFKNGVAYAIDKDGTRCLVTDKGDFLLRGFQDCREFHEELAAIRIKDKWGYVNLQGKLAIRPQYAKVSDFRLGRALVQDSKGEEWQIDRKGKIITTKAWLATYGFPQEIRDHRHYCEVIKEGTVRVFDWKLHLWGYANANNKIVIPCKFEDAENFNDGLALVKNGGKSGFINHKGDYIVQPIYDDATSFSNGLAFVATENKETGEKQWGAIDVTGCVAIPLKFKSISTCHRYMTDSWIERMHKLPTHLALAEVKEGEYAIIDMRGNSILAIKGKEVTIIENNQLIVENETDSRIIDLSGRVLVPPIYRTIGDHLSSGLRRVWRQSNTGYGFIDRYGQEVIAPSYEYAENFQHGLARVAVDSTPGIPNILGGKWGYINTSGEWVWKPTN